MFYNVFPLSLDAIYLFMKAAFSYDEPRWLCYSTDEPIITADLLLDCWNKEKGHWKQHPPLIAHQRQVTDRKLTSSMNGVMKFFDFKYFESQRNGNQF